MADFKPCFNKVIVLEGVIPFMKSQVIAEA